MLKYEIEGGHLPVVICYPEVGQTLCCEGGSMSWMSPNMQMETTSGGGAKKVFGRLFSGESLFMNEYSPRGGSGVIAFASNFPGSIIPYQVKPGQGIVVQKRGFLAMEKGLDVSIYFQKKASKGFFGGEGFIMQRVTGDGLTRFNQLKPLTNVAFSSLFILLALITFIPVLFVFIISISSEASIIFFSSIRPTVKFCERFFRSACTVSLPSMSDITA